MKKVITYGTFDLFHQGHIRLLERAKKLGDYLIVGVTSEDYDRFRGKLNVRQNLIERVKNIESCGLADEIVIEEYEGQKIDDIRRLDVDVFAIGSDWVGRFDYLNEYCKVIYLDRTKGISSTELRNQGLPLIQIGLVGSGRIAERFLKESKFVSGVGITGVFGIHESSAQYFASQHELDFYETCYDDFLERVNAVYIASPHGTHYAYAKQAILQGKHVLCEKPMTLQRKQAEELFSLANEHGVVLLEALKTAYCPGFKRLISTAKSGKIGVIKSVEATFTKLVPLNSRELNPKMNGGSTYELASYPLLPIFNLLGTEYMDVSFHSYMDPSLQVDLYTKIDIKFKNAIATAKIGLGVKGEGSLVISGTRGYIYVPAPWWKTDYFEIRFEDAGDTEKYFYKFMGDGLRYELVEFLEQIVYKKADQGNQNISIAISGIMEKYSEEYNLLKID